MLGTEVLCAFIKERPKPPPSSRIQTGLMTEDVLTMQSAMRLVSCFLTTAVVLFSSCTTEPTEIVLPTVTDLGFEWQVPYALSLDSDGHQETWRGTAVWIDRGTLMLSFQDAGASEMGTEVDFSSEVLTYDYQDSDKTVRISLPMGHLKLQWDGTRQSFVGDIFGGDILVISKTEGVR